MGAATPGALAPAGINVGGVVGCIVGTPTLARLVGCIVIVLAVGAMAVGSAVVGNGAGDIVGSISVGVLVGLMVGQPGATVPAPG